MKYIFFIPLVFLVNFNLFSQDKYYNPTISNLRLRDQPVNGKVIRMLTQDDKLKFIEKGKKDTINGIDGFWIKIETEKKEFGWCFNGYLKELPQNSQEFKTYKDSKYNLSFNYPSSWEKFKINDLEPDNMFITIPTRYISSKNTIKPEYEVSINISKYSDYIKDNSNEISQLKKIFTEKTAKNMQPLYLPPPNAGMIANTAPEFIESNNGKFRGIFYYANIAQDYMPYIDCVAVLSDGTDIIITFLFNIKSDKYKQYEAQNKIDAFKTYISKLNNSNETIVKEFNKNLKNIILSLSK